MHQLATVLLRHDSRRQTHYDWMLTKPPDSCLLWTARVTWPSWCWSFVGRWDVHVIGEHRPAFLTYQGPLTGGRGTVCQVDIGFILPRLWTTTKIVFDLRMTRCAGRISLDHVSGHLWRASMM